MPFQVLTPAQHDFFHKHGYLYLKSFVPEHALNEVQLPINRWVNRQIKGWKKKGLITNDFANLPFDLRLFHTWEAAGRPPYKEYISQEIASPEVFNFLTQPCFVKLAQDLLEGSNIQVLAGYLCRPKLPSSVFPIVTPWHQDAQCAAYHGKQDSRFMTIWVPFMDVDDSNSCLQVSEYSHINTSIYDDAKDGSVHYSIHPEHSKKFTNLKSIPMKRGDALCLHQLVAHRALPNPSNKMRWSMDIRFERFDGKDAPVPRRGFICAHQDPSKIESTFEEGFKDLWAYLDQPANGD